MLCMEPATGHHDDIVKHLLSQAHCALQASNATQALQYVIEALTLVRGDSAVIPTLRHAAEQYHLQRTAPIHEISALLAQVSLQAGQQQQQQQEQQQQQKERQEQRTAVHIPHLPKQQYQQQQQQQLCGTQQSGMPGVSYSALLAQQQQQQQQPETLKSSLCQVASTAILNETGRGELTSYALADGSSWQCPHCAGVVSVHRREAHLNTWCPQLQLSSKGDSGVDMVQ